MPRVKRSHDIEADRLKKGKISCCSGNMDFRKFFNTSEMTGMVEIKGTPSTADTDEVPSSQPRGDSTIPSSQLRGDSPIPSSQPRDSPREIFVGSNDVDSILSSLDTGKSYMNKPLSEEAVADFEQELQTLSQKTEAVLRGPETAHMSPQDQRRHELGFLKTQCSKSNMKNDLSRHQ